MILKVFKKVILLKPFKMSDNITETIQNERFFFSNPPPRHFFSNFSSAPLLLPPTCLSQYLATYIFQWAHSLRPPADETIFHLAHNEK